MNIVELLEKLIVFIQNSGLIGVLVSCGLTTIESILPMLPLIVFITINKLVLGNILGFIVSWVFTVIGCCMSYFIFRKGFGNKFEKLTENKELLKKYKKVLKNISTGKLVLIIAMPFTPAFMVNIVAGLVKMDFKKYFVALLIGKLSMVYFLGYIGTSFIESITNPVILVQIILILCGTYLLYYIVNKVLKIE